MKTEPRRALGMIECNSVSRGVVVTDAMLKTSGVTLLQSSPICPGKYLSLVAGTVDAVRACLERGVEAAHPFLVDSVLIPDVHPDVQKAASFSASPETIDALGLVETHSLATCLEVADRVAKAADVRLIEVRLGKCMGGKAFVSFTGDVAAVEAARAVGADLARRRGVLVHDIAIARPHGDVHRFLV